MNNADQGMNSRIDIQNQFDEVQEEEEEQIRENYGLLNDKYLFEELLERLKLVRKRCYNQYQREAHNEPDVIYNPEYFFPDRYLIDLA